MKIVWSQLAVDRVGEIAKYIAFDNSNISKRWVNKIFDKVKRLELFPESGKIVLELNRPEIREIIFGNYRIIYKLKQSQVSILTVRYGKQILPINEIDAK